MDGAENIKKEMLEEAQKEVDTIDKDTAEKVAGITKQQ